MSVTYTAQLINHYEKVWRQRANYRRLLRGVGHHLPREFKVLEFEPGGRRDVWTYATCGMSPATDRTRTEVHLFSPRESIETVEILYEISHFHRHSHRLGPGHSINLGRGWMDRSRCSWGLVAKPFLDGPHLERFAIPESEKATLCLWLIPITRRERDFKVEFGVDALTTVFKEKGVNFLDPKRSSAV